MSIVAYGPARTVEQSTTRMPTSGPRAETEGVATGRW